MDVQAIQRAKRAASLGMTLDAYDAHVAEQRAKSQAIHRARTDRAYCCNVLSTYATERGTRLTWYEVVPS